jgi:hypothetical protein
MPLFREAVLGPAFTPGWAFGRAPLPARLGLAATGGEAKPGESRHCRVASDPS